MAQNSSRLQRLLTLLDTGSTQATRFAAARQIGDIAKSHPQDLSSLLKKVSHYLRSRNWDTRVAAAHAVGAIAQNVKHTSLKELLELLEAEMTVAGYLDATKDMKTTFLNTYPRVSVGLSFKSFDINRVLEFGSPLLASGGQEYDVTNDGSKNPAERLSRQKANLRRRLGLDGCEHFMDVNDVIKDEDLVVHKSFSGVIVPNHQYSTSRPGQHIQQLVATMVAPKRLSARELNLLKRKAKVSAKDQTKSSATDDSHSKPHPQISENSKGAWSEPLSSVKDTSDSIPDEDSVEHCESGTWPLRPFLEQLVHDMFDPLWEVRHGAIMALREILTHQGSSAGVYFPDLSLDIPFSVDCDIRDLDSTKKGCEIDLNLQFSDDDYEPDSKRHKAEKDYFPQNSREFSENPMTCSAGMNVDGYPLNPISASVNGNINISHVKVEPDIFKNALNPQIKAEVTTLEPVFENNSLLNHQIKEEVTPLFENSSSFSRMNFLANLPESCNLMKLIKLARHSWNKNWEFLQDCAIRFLCVLSLDRFGDYVSDQVVAPVRETCAQALGAVLKFMHPSLVRDTLRILLQMQCRQEWEVRHGSLLGIKYLVAVRPEMLPELLIHVLPACKTGLEDPDDDVRAVAAEALIPAASAIVSLSDDRWLHSIVMLLWDILLDLDDLSPSTSSVMNLLAEIYSLQAMVPKMLENVKVDGKQEFDLNEMSQTEEHLDGIRSRENPCMFSTLTPRLWPFMRHSITSVRHSAIRTLERLLEVSYTRSSHGPMSSAMCWPASILCDALRIVFQNMLLESDEDILHSSKRVWRLLLQCPEQDLEYASQSYFSSWLQLATTPYGSALDATKMYWPVAPPCRSRSRAAAKMRAVMYENGSNINFAHESHKENVLQERSSDISLNVTRIIVGADVSASTVSMTRFASATALGIFASRLPIASLQVVVDSLWNDLVSLSGVQRQVASIVLIAWFKELKARDPAFNQGPIPHLLDHVKSWLLDLLSCSDPSFPTKNSLLPYAELSRTYAKMRSEVNLLLRSVESLDACKDYVSSINFECASISVDDAYSFANNLRQALLDKQQSLDKLLLDGITSSIQEFERTVAYLKCIQNNLHIAVTALVASAVVHMSELPSKLNPVILPLMAAIKREQEEILQQNAAEALAELIFHCVGRKPSPNDKLVKNLCNLTCADFVETPQAKTLKSIEVIEEQNLLYVGKSGGTQKSKEDRTKSEGFISRRGSEMALKYLCELFGSSLFEKLPKLWDCLMEVLKPVPPHCSLTDEQILEVTNSEPQVLINNIQVVRSIAPVLDESLRPQLLALLPCILSCVRHHHVAVRLAASRCLTSMANSMMTCVMGDIVEKVITMLSDAESVYARQGAGMLVNLLVQGLGVQLVPYAPVLVVPLLRCMSDSDHSVRQTVTHSFAAVVPLLPLARGLPAPAGLSESLSKNAEDAQFLDQLLDNSQIEDFRIPFDLKVSLRRYQQEGINWLAFLRRFKLHGILCDDMGLGKTLQASSIVAADIVERRASTSKDLSSLIICPSTLVGHWAYEIEKYIDASLLISLQYTGSNPERLALRDQFEQCNVIITSYDVIRKDIDFLGTLAWNYCILDEGHIIKNSRSKITLAVKQLNAQHRLILSGTPIQNNVLELWSLFDFLMPGFLGTERQFQATYGKPLLAAKDSKCNAKDAEAGVLAMEALHKQVMPFLLRRTKDEVLSDLPEKIIQDRYCDLSPLQLKLYEQFSSSNAKKEISELVNDSDKTSTVEGTAAPRATSHVFQAMQYLLKLCSHPLLVVGEKPPDSLSSILAEAFPSCDDISKELHELQHSPKLVALKEILEECGIGLDASNGESNEAVGHHRVLIFAQHKSLLDVIERDLFMGNMKSVTYLRLDGSVNPEKRFGIVKTFNSDPTIDVLLLTTHVGGLGLNLTSADTIVFMEHDWNPMKDLQAMDRAHRLGQRKVVNVHRLIMRGTLEEKIMSLQRFKLSVANAVVNTENSSLKTMNTDQLLDLFTPASTTRKGAPSSSVSHGDKVTDGNAVAGGGKGLKSVLSGLDELWDQSQYTDEYNMSQFLAKLNG